MRALVGAVLSASLLSAPRAKAEPSAGPEVLIEGQRSTRPTREPTLAGTRVDVRELSRPGADAAAILSHVPGVQISRTGGGADLATASLRGATSAQTPVYLAGIRLNDDLTGTADLSLVPLWMLSRAEVYRGNAPADADRLGIGGAIYFEPRVPQRSRVGAGAELGSFGQHAGFVGAELADRDDAALVSFRAASAKNDYPYLDNAGTSGSNDDRTRARPNADYSERDAWAIGRTSLGRRGARVTTVFNAFEREQGVTGLAAVPALSARAESARLLAGLSAKLPCGAHPGCEIVLGSQAISSSARLSDPRRELGLLVERVDSHATRVAQSAHISLSGTVLQALLAANFESERLTLDGGRTLRATRSTSSARAGLSAALGEHLGLSALGAVSCELTRGPDQAQSCAALMPAGRVGVRVKWGVVEVRGNVGHYTRVPTLGELYGVSALVRGSSALVAERGTSSDLGARWEGEIGPLRAYVDAFGFARHVSELIAYRRSSLGAIQPYNVGSARLLGAELEASAEWARHVRSLLSLTLLDPRDTTGSRHLNNDLVPYQSRLLGSVLLEGYFELGLPLIRRGGLDARLSYRGSRLADPAGLLVLPASSELDLGATLQCGGASQFSARLAVDDVLDTRHFDFIGYPVPGRSWHLALEAWW